MTTGDKIKFYREMKGMNQADLAKASGIPLATIQKYEINTRNPKEEPLKKISEALEVSTNVFLEAEHSTVGDISALFFLLSKYTDLDIHGDKKDGKYSPSDVSFSFSNPLLQEFLADWASSTESSREMRKNAKNFDDESIQKPMLESAETLERTLEYNKINCNIRL
ncbi:MAG: helix-turn-helix transcriptional regulator [Bacillota bacterium]|nr:helix-turn-helix transcriptional regulator [Bacillota bacterium]